MVLAALPPFTEDVDAYGHRQQPQAGDLRRSQAGDAREVITAAKFEEETGDALNDHVDNKEAVAATTGLSAEQRRADRGSCRWRRPDAEYRRAVTPDRCELHRRGTAGPSRD